MNHKEDIELRQNVMLAFQVALLGMVPPHLRGVTVKWDSEKIYGVFIFDGAITDIEQEIVSDVEGEVLSHFSEHTIDCVAKNVEHPTSFTGEQLTTWVYLRMEE